MITKENNYKEKSPITLEELRLLKNTFLWDQYDDENLKMASEVLKDQTEDITDLCYSFIGSIDHLLNYFCDIKTQDLDTDYLQHVKKGLGEWVLNLCNCPYDQEWLDYQHGIALQQHHRENNKADGTATFPVIHYSHMVGSIVPFTLIIKRFLATKGHDTDTVEKMHSSLFKATTLAIILITHQYINKGEF